MEFILPFQIQPYPFTISYQNKMLFLGSCFSEEIGNRMIGLKFTVLQNPNGILYNPVSITDALFSYIDNNNYSEKNLFKLDGIWHSWKHHSAFSGINKDEVVKKINTSQSAAHAFLKEAEFLIITLGTAFNYQLKNSKENVANCHKAPQEFFIKELLTINEIEASLLSHISALEVFNPGLKIIYTVSPVKHIKDGVVENNRSKARLLEAIHGVCEQKQQVFYFPSYELVTDVLRDYRFYKNDLVHPNETAVQYIFENFCTALLDDEAKTITYKIRNILKAVHHKPFFIEGEEYKKFVAAQLKNISTLGKSCPFINLSAERDYFENQI